MNQNVPARKIYLDDAISRHKTGVSPIREKQIVANRFDLWKKLLNVSLLSTAYFSYLTFNKLYTNRLVYGTTFVINLAISGLLFINFKHLKSETIKKLECSEENFKDFLWFYKHAVLDKPNYFEETQKH